MPNPRQRISQVRQALGARRDSGATDQPVFARARLDTAELTERYHYEQEISRNPSQRMTEPPTGRIELTLPYDGYEYFTRQARADVARQHRDTEALVAHLLVGDYGKTDLAEVLGLTGGYGSVPIKVPIDDGILSSDKHVCRIEHDYAPNEDAVRLIPIDVQVELVDPDGVELHDLLLEGASAKAGIVDEVAKRITQQVGFRSYLQLSITVSLHLPNQSGMRELTPKVAHVSLDWPTMTSLGALRLTVPGGGEVPLRYNPRTPSIEWSDVPMELVDTKADPDEEQLHGDMLTFQSRPMLLRIDQPGELYKQPSLDGRVEVEVPGHLLSGTRARLFNAIGTKPRKQPALTSHVSTDLHLILDDAFARRLLLPYQHLYFEEVIPDEMRIADIVTALKGKGFDVEVIPGGQQTEDVRRHLLLASRSAGPDVMRLWLFVEGRHFETERQKQLPGGHTFKSKFDSGDLKVFMCGALPGTSRELTQVMNALQQALRERFERLKARR